MKHIAIALGLMLVQTGAALAAPQIKPPACGALEAWGTRVTAETYNVAPRLTLPKALEDTQIVPLFGVGVLSWTQEDLQAANQALTQCYGEAGKRRDAAAAGALANANRALQGLVPRTNAALQKAAADLAPLKQQIAGLPDSSDLDRGLAVLLKVNPAQPDNAPFRALKQPIADPLWRLAAQVLPVLANGQREALFKELGDRHATIQSAMASEAEKVLAAAPADADGMIQLIAMPQHVAVLDDVALRARLEQSARERVKQIGDTLRQAKPPVWVAPNCVELYRWSGGTNATAGVAVGGRSMMSAFLDQQVVPVFGLSLAEWSDQDLTRFKPLRGLCQSGLQEAAAVRGYSGPNAPELVQLAGRGRWIDGADAQIAEAKTAIGAYQHARQALAADLEKAAQLPDNTASLVPLAQIAVDPAQNQVTPEERARFVNAINEKRAAIGAHASDAAIKGLAEVKLASLGDLKNLLAYMGKTMPTIPDPRGQQAFRDAFNRTLQEATARLLPEFKAKLDAAPASLANVAEANQTLLQLGLATNQVVATPAYQTYYKAMEQSRDAVAKSAYGHACTEFLSSVGAAGDAKEPLFWGGFGPGASTLGDFLCAVAERGHQVSYAGAGLLSSTSTLKVTPINEGMQTISMHKAEAQPGKKMLVGYDVTDANGSSANHGPTPTGKISIEEWTLISNDLTGRGRETDVCLKKIDDPAPDKLDPATKLLWLHCWELAPVRVHVAQRLQGAR